MNSPMSKSLYTAAILAAATSSSFGIFSQGFEVEGDTSGFTPRGEGSITNVPSGGGLIGATSLSGGRHGEIGLINEDFETGFGWGASWNDNAGAGPFINGSGVAFSAFLDNPARGLDFYDAGDGWWFQPTLLNAAGTSAVSGGGFGVRHTGSSWQIAATGNERAGFDYGVHFAAHPQNSDAAFTFGTTYTATTGWYRFETLWFLNGTGGIDQVNSIYNAGGTPVFIATISNAVADASLAGSIGTAWIGQDGDFAGNGPSHSGSPVPQSLMGDLAIDNVTVIPEPGTVSALLGLFAGAVVLFVRRRRKA
jgi:hypothetical protein